MPCKHVSALCPFVPAKYYKIEWEEDQETMLQDLGLGLGRDAGRWALAAAVALGIAFEVLGARLAISLASLVVLVLVSVAARVRENDADAREKREVTLDELVPSRPGDRTDEEEAPPTADELAGQVSIPQDASYQVPVVAQRSYTFIPRHSAVADLLPGLAEARRRRPAAVALFLATLERFLATHERLTKQRVPRIGNGRVHEIARQRLSNMHVLRQDLLEQLRPALFEFSAAASKAREVQHVQQVQQVTNTVRDYTHALYVTCARRWAKALPAYNDSGAPPHGRIAYTAHEVDTSMYRV